MGNLHFGCSKMFLVYVTAVYGLPVSKCGSTIPLVENTASQAIRMVSNGEKESVLRTM